MIAFAVLALAAPLAHSKPLVAHAAHSGPKVESQVATEISQQGATLRARIGTYDRDTWYRFEYGATTSYGSATPVGHLAGGHGKVDVASVVTGLAPGTTYHFRAVAANDDDFAMGPDATFTTAAASAPSPPPGPGATEPAAPPTFQPVPEPAMGRTVVAQVAAGTVLVKEKGSSEFRPLSTTDAMPVNSIIDARQGTVSLTTARGGGVSQAATFRGGMFQVRQSRAGKGMTDIFLRGGSFAACPKAGARSSRTASAAATRKVRRLWSSDHHGRFRTHGKNSVATVRGTSWYTEERCDGTLTRVRSGKVLVRERGTGRTKLLTRGHSFLARATAPARATAVPNGTLGHAAGAGKPIIAAQSPNGISDHSAKLRANVDPNGENTTYHFELGTTSAYGSSTSDGTLKKDDNPTDVSSTVTGLTVATTYHFRVVATNNKGTTYGPDGSFTTSGTTPVSPPPDGTPAPDGQPAPPPETAPTVSAPTPEPALGRTVVAGTAKGTVLVRESGTSGWVPLTSTDVVPVNSVIDARQGTVLLVTARGGGVSQPATFRGGMFQVRQASSGHGMTDIVLRGASFSSCPRTTARSSQAVASAKRRVRRLWSSDHNGRFRTQGRGSVATVRGTSWYTEERCDGTLTRVFAGKVLVRERGTGRTKLVTRGHSFLARAPH